MFTTVKKVTTVIKGHSTQAIKEIMEDFKAFHKGIDEDFFHKTSVKDSPKSSAKSYETSVSIDDGIVSITGDYKKILINGREIRLPEPAPNESVRR